MDHDDEKGRGRVDEERGSGDLPLLRSPSLRSSSESPITDSSSTPSDSSPESNDSSSQEQPATGNSQSSSSVSDTPFMQNVVLGGSPLEGMESVSISMASPTSNPSLTSPIERAANPVPPPILSPSDQDLNPGPVIIEPSVRLIQGPVQDIAVPIGDRSCWKQIRPCVCVIVCVVVLIIILALLLYALTNAVYVKRRDERSSS